MTIVEMMQNSQKGFTLSIVSHGQAPLVKNLLDDLALLELPSKSEVVLTVNIPEDETIFGPNIGVVDRILRNPQPKGFGANHNAAFKHASSTIFVVVNPDVRLSSVNFESFSKIFEDPTVGACAPKVVTPSGDVEDNFRRFPSISRLVSRVVFRRRRPDYELSDEILSVDWVAGMFVAYSANAFRLQGGFDESYFMYLEDADICRRLSFGGFRIVVQPCETIIHDAQRSSSKDFRHFLWHLRSAVRFLFHI